MIKIACIQAPVVFDDPAANVRYAIEKLRDLKAKGVDLVVFPEAFLTGYCADDSAQARSISISVDHESLQAIAALCDEMEMLAVVGFAERDESGLYNSAALLENGQAPRIYRKTHLPELGLDKHVSPGEEIRVFETRLGRIGVLVCFDMRYPEATRSLALQGADIVCLPTNWPVGAEVSATHICIARAAENRIFFATCNRIGEENGFRFIGLSKIIAPSGEVLASAEDLEAVLIAELDLEQARTKRTVTIPGKYETEVMGLRRPDLYKLE